MDAFTSPAKGVTLLKQGDLRTFSAPSVSQCSFSPEDLEAPVNPNPLLVICHKLPCFCSWIMSECVKKKGKFKFWLPVRIFDSRWPAGKYFVAHGVWWHRREPVRSPEAVTVTSICFPIARAGTQERWALGERNSQVKTHGPEQRRESRLGCCLTLVPPRAKACRHLQHRGACFPFPDILVWGRGLMMAFSVGK